MIPIHQSAAVIANAAEFSGAVIADQFLTHPVTTHAIFEVGGAAAFTVERQVVMALVAEPYILHFLHVIPVFPLQALLTLNHSAALGAHYLPTIGAILRDFVSTARTLHHLYLCLLHGSSPLSSCTCAIARLRVKK
jgi:hypothetical protein